MAKSSNLITNPVVVVRALTSYQQVLDASPQITTRVSPGDIVLSYRNQSFASLFDSVGTMSGGANSYGGMRAYLNFITFRSMKMFLKPDETTVEYVIKKKSGHSFHVKAPLMMRIDKSCVEAASRKPDVNVLTQGHKIDPAVQKKLISESKTQLNDMRHPFFEELKESFDQVLDYPKNTTKETTLSWSIIRKNSSTIGIIRLDSFMPARLTSENVIILLKSLLVKELKDTSGLIFDVRNNGGGTDSNIS